MNHLFSFGGGGKFALRVSYVFRINSNYFAQRRFIVGVYNEDAMYFCEVGSEFENIIEIIFKFEGYNTSVTELFGGRAWHLEIKTRPSSYLT